MSKLIVKIDGQIFDVELSLIPVNGPGLQVRVNGQPVQVIVPNMSAPLEEIDWAVVDGRPYEISFDPDLHWIRSGYGLHRLEIQDAGISVSRPCSGDGRIQAPIPGQITLILAGVGERVSAGQTLLILEAMKMENHIRAPFDGVVRSVQVSAGQNVKLRDVLVEIE